MSNKCLKCYYVTERKINRKTVHLCDATHLINWILADNYMKDIREIKDDYCFSKEPLTAPINII